MDIVDTSDARPRGLCVFGEADIDDTNCKTEKTQYNNTKFIVLDIWLGVLLAAPGVRIGGGRADALFMDKNVVGFCIHVSERVLYQVI